MIVKILNFDFIMDIHNPCTHITTWNNLRLKMYFLIIRNTFCVVFQILRKYCFLKYLNIYFKTYSTQYCIPPVLFYDFDVKISWRTCYNYIITADVFFSEEIVVVVVVAFFLVSYRHRNIARNIVVRCVAIPKLFINLQYTNIMSHTMSRNR